MGAQVPCAKSPPPIRRDEDRPQYGRLVFMSWAIWITGIPGSGKTTCARAAGEELRARGYPVRILELDPIRKTLTPEPRYTDNERDVVYRALGWMARLLTEASIPVIV